MAGLTRPLPERKRPLNERIDYWADPMPLHLDVRLKRTQHRLETIGDLAKLTVDELNQAVGMRATASVLLYLARRGVPLADGTFLRIPKDTNARFNL